jgi:thioredoxin reductase (NADPH)
MIRNYVGFPRGIGGGDLAHRACVILATGVTYRRLGITELDRLVGAGVFYGAAGVMAQAVSGQEVYVVGGANSAGQAALHLAKYAARVTLLVRGSSLAAADVGLPGPADRRDTQHRCAARHPERGRPG